MEQLDDCQLIVLNAYVGRGQMTLLKRIYGKFVFEDKKVAVITSTSGTPMGEDEELLDPEYAEYCKNKKNFNRLHRRTYNKNY